MRLFVSLGESSVNELKFDRGPIYVGRQTGSQVFLPDKAVSRQHAVFYSTKDGTWILEDMGSSNKTYLNSQAIHKTELKHNDVVRIGDFLIRVSLEEDEHHDSKTGMEETQLGGESGASKELHTVERKPEAPDSPPIKFPSKRIKQYQEVVDVLTRQKTANTLFRSLMDVLFRHFTAKNIWMAVRSKPDGAMEIQSGRKITTENIERVDLAVPASLAEAIAGNKYLLIHQLPRQITVRGIRSALIAPMLAGAECYGIIYIENSTEHPHYSLPDLDYLIFVSIAAGYAMRALPHG
ncbi:MAG: FHA domain-containing protein [Planctomycetaceae bacterium]|nr:FHA domain-containing protein [Planctomycetaceae bacterium]